MSNVIQLFYDYLYTEFLAVFSKFEMFDLILWQEVSFGSLISTILTILVFTLIIGMVLSFVFVPLKIIRGR